MIFILSAVSLQSMLFRFRERERERERDRANVILDRHSYLAPQVVSLTVHETGLRQPFRGGIRSEYFELGFVMPTLKLPTMKEKKAS